MRPTNESDIDFVCDCRIQIPFAILIFAFAYRNYSEGRFLVSIYVAVLDSELK